MAKTKDEKLVDFYSECQLKGYTNMQDDIQSLKAKVIAADLGLDYKNIGLLYENAKKVVEERKHLDSIQGELFFECFSWDSESTPCLSLYSYDELSYYSIIHHPREQDEKIFDIPKITIERAMDLNTYHYAPTIETYGFSYNGMGSSTSYYNPERTEYKLEKSNSGYINFSINDKKFLISKIKLSPKLIDAFKRDDVFKNLFNGNDALILYRMELPDCNKAISLLNRMLKQQLPTSDQEIYEKALKLSTSDRSYNIEEAITAFEFISDYKDSIQQAEKAKKKYNEVRQLEKENAIIQEERRSKKAKKIATYGAIALVSIITIVIIVFRIILPAQRNNKAYEEAISLSSQGKYDAAIEIFTLLDNYKDSKEKVLETQAAKTEAAYQKALSLYDLQDYSGAYQIFLQLTGYKDVDERMNKDKNLVAEKIKVFKTVGNIVSFGHYEQDNDFSNGKEEIEWIVLANQGNQSLLISRYILDSQPYNTKMVYKTDNTWESCSLRNWLNSEFLQTAFSLEEQDAILTTTVDNSKSQGNNEWDTPDEKDTIDKIFLLSYAEAEKYLGSSTYDCEKTAYARDRGASLGWWWLRSPLSNGGASRSHTSTSLSWIDIDCNTMGVRPVLWLNLEF